MRRGRATTSYASEYRPPVRTCVKLWDTAKPGGALATLVSWRKFVTNRYLSKTVYLILCMGCSVLGATYDPFFFAFHLLELFFVVQLLQVALDAVSRNGSQLMYAVLMGLILTYIFAVLGWKLIIAHDIMQYGFNVSPSKI